MMTKRLVPRVTIGSMERAAEAAGYALVCGPDFEWPSRGARSSWRQGMVVATAVLMAGVFAVSFLVA